MIEFVMSDGVLALQRGLPLLGQAIRASRVRIFSDGVSTNVPPDKTKSCFHPPGCRRADRIPTCRSQLYVYQLLGETPVRRPLYQMHREPCIKINKFGNPDGIRTYTPVIVTIGSIRLSFGAFIILLCQSQHQSFT